MVTTYNSTVFNYLMQPPIMSFLIHILLQSISCGPFMQNTSVNQWTWLKTC